MSGDEDRYVIEAILDARNIRGHWDYFVKWQGYPDSSSTWEPEANFDPDDLKEFWATRNREDYIQTSEMVILPTHTLELGGPGALEYLRRHYPQLDSPQDITEIITVFRKPNGKVWYWVRSPKYTQPVCVSSSVVRRLALGLLVRFLEANLTFSQESNTEKKSEQDESE
jgi:hypothetical protein